MCWTSSSTHRNELSRADQVRAQEHASLPTTNATDLGHAQKVWKLPGSRPQRSSKRARSGGAGDKQSQGVGTGAESEADFGRPLKQTCVRPHEAHHAGQKQPDLLTTSGCSSVLSRRASSSFRCPLADGEQVEKELFSKPKKSLRGSQGTRNWCLATCSNLSVRWHRKQATFVLIGFLRSLIGWLQQLLSAHENPYLQGNFAPCAETAPLQLEVEGSLPTELDGAYIRNGPNPVLPSTGKCNW